MSERRFTDKAELDPGAVWALPDDHPAMIGNRTLFPTTVVESFDDMPNGLLVSGHNNRKLGSVVEKGAFKGYHLYSLTLEERATCPTDCSERAICYGNGMQFARRNTIDADGKFFAFLEAEISGLLATQIPGLLIRLHVLGDFPSVDYVAFWADMLAEHDNLACYGYTHRRTRNWGGDAIGDAIEALKDRYPDRFRIRWSSPAPRPDGAVVIARVPERHRVDEGMVCPAQTDATGCCATCGLCWEKSARKETIVFVRHGKKSMSSAAETAMSEARTPVTPADANATVEARDNPKADDFERSLVAAMPKLKTYCISLTHDHIKAEDLLQETVMRALRARASFDGANLNAWLFTIAKNNLRSSYRKFKREIEDPDGEFGKHLRSNDDVEAALEAKQVFEQFEKLPAYYREPMLDNALGMSYEDVANRHEIPQGTAKSRISRGRDRLRSVSDNPERSHSGHSLPPASNKPATASPVTLSPAALAETRAIKAIVLPPSIKPKHVSSKPPSVRHVSPTLLRVEERYQRGLTGKSITLIRNIVENWSWAKFKPPICVETPLGLFVIDGQHTAIAAASHPWIHMIPVLIVSAATEPERADAFVAHNRDRLAMSPFQVFHGEVVAKNPEACAIMAVVTSAGAIIPRNPVGKNSAKPGQIVPLSQIRVIYRTDGPEALKTMLEIAVKARLTPISRTTLRAIRMIVREPRFKAMIARGPDEVARAMAGIPNIDLAAETFAVSSGQNRDRACAILVENALASTNPENRSRSPQFISQSPTLG